MRLGATVENVLKHSVVNPKLEGLHFVFAGLLDQGKKSRAGDQSVGLCTPKGVLCRTLGFLTFVQLGNGHAITACTQKITHLFGLEKRTIFGSENP